jgi:hypothetical protein
MHVSRKAGLRFGSPALNPEERDVVQVGLAGAVSSKDKKFRTMHEGCGGTIKEPKTCSKCEKTVEQEDLVSGYEYAKDEFIVFTRPELDALDVEKTPFIDVTKFVLYEELDLTMLASQYYCSRQGGSWKVRGAVSGAHHDESGRDRVNDHLGERASDRGLPSRRRADARDLEPARGPRRA